MKVNFLAETEIQRQQAANKNYESRKYWKFCKDKNLNGNSADFKRKTFKNFITR